MMIGDVKGLHVKSTAAINAVVNKSKEPIELNGQNGMKRKKKQITAF